MTSYINIKRVVDLNAIYKLVVDNPFIWDHLETPIFILSSLIMKFK
jgi:hypothetical protein